MPVCSADSPSVNSTSLSPAGKFMVHQNHQPLSCYCFLFFTERLSLARIYPLQAKKVDTFIMLFFRLCLSHHLLSGFSMYRRILRRKAKYVGVSYFRLTKKMSNAHLNTANHFTFQKLDFTPSIAVSGFRGLVGSIL